MERRGHLVLQGGAGLLARLLSAEPLRLLLEVRLRRALLLLLLLQRQLQLRYLRGARRAPRGSVGGAAGCRVGEGLEVAEREEKEEKKREEKRRLSFFCYG